MSGRAQSGAVVPTPANPKVFEHKANPCQNTHNGSAPASHAVVTRIRRNKPAVSFLQVYEIPTPGEANVRVAATTFAQHGALQ
ncbi:hypothetical protein MYCOZU2_06067 (plasmid) [Mycobacterium intracellulare subsp. chimaera]|uniref:Uncharacterized protein n=1 Tax=Mycobacterium intracellulare subsp. chimaera TaxID=222805 RepID=A0A7U5MRN6_MYCIT|nr:hypothetical protein MYCOZU2_06067 [Mycobacterium intracellulare subsp. chimaera]